MYSSPLLHLVGGFLLFYARKTCSSPFYQSHRHAASQPETTICSYNQESKFCFRFFVLKESSTPSPQELSSSIFQSCESFCQASMTSAKIISTNRIAVLNWPSTQFHHLVTHTWANGILCCKSEQTKTLAAQLLVEWGMAEGWEMQIKLRNCAKGCFEIEISTNFTFWN